MQRLAIRVIPIVLIATTAITGLICARAPGPTQEVYIPKDLEDCLAQLHKIVKTEDVEQMKAIPEQEMVRYHRSLGLWIRNNWGLWTGSRLAKWFNSEGIVHPDDMSSIILRSFWRRLASRPIAFGDQVKHCRQYWKDIERAERLEDERARQASEMISKSMLGLSVIDSARAPIPFPRRSDGGVRAGFLAKYRSGVLLGRSEGDRHDPTRFVAAAYYLDVAKKTVHPVRIPEFEALQSVVVADTIAYFSGTSKGRHALVAVGGGNRSVIHLPLPDESPQLGVDASRLLAVYRRSIYRLEDGKWAVLHSGNTDLPRSGSPPRRVRDQVFFLEKSDSEIKRGLGWLNLGKCPGMVFLAEDIGLVGRRGLRWENSLSYCWSANGDLWAALGLEKTSVIRRSVDGSHGIATINDRVTFDGALQGESHSDAALPISAVSCISGQVLVAAGRSGLYSVDGKSIEVLLRFANTAQDIRESDGSTYHWQWIPTNILLLRPRCYVAAGEYGGVYLIQPEADEKRAVVPLDDRLGHVVSF